MRHLIIIILMLAYGMSMTYAQSIPGINKKPPSETEIFFNAYVSNEDEVLADILMEKAKGIIGRTGCGKENAEYMIVPSIQVDETERSSGMIRNVTLIKGSLSLMAVSRANKDAVWHSVTIPLEATVTGEVSDPALKLAHQIKINDAVYVRFVRVARRKISEFFSNNQTDTYP